MAGIKCWEYQNCKTPELCPAYPDKGFACWTVKGTLCRGEKQGSYEEKVKFCRSTCPFYDGVMTGTLKLV